MVRGCFVAAFSSRLTIVELAINVTVYQRGLEKDVGSVKKNKTKS